MWTRTRSNGAARWIVWGLVVGAAVSCGGLLDIDTPRRVPKDAGTGPGEAGDTGGGVGGMLGGTGGGSGSSGAASGGVVGGSGGTAGSSGAQGGTGGEPPTLGEACSAEDAVSCTNANRNIVLRCTDKTWVLQESCPQYQRCSADDPQHQECAPIPEKCIPNGTYCQDDGQLWDCDTNLFQVTHRQCPFGCEAGRCLPGAPNELTVHDEVVDGSIAYWPGGIIPVCFLSSDDDTLDALTQDELGRSWGRYLNVHFEFSACAPEGAPGVAIEYLDECRGRLGSSFFYGFPGQNKQLRVGLCKTYIDAEADGEVEKPVEEALFRFVVRHEFGHVLGLGEADLVRSDSTMVRGLAEPQAEAHSISASDLSTMLIAYNRKPSRSFVTSRGKCLTAFGAELRAIECSPISGRFSLESGMVESLAPGMARCALADESGAVTLGACGDTALRFGPVRWSTVSECAVGQGTGVGLAPCNAATHALDWSLEVISSDAQKLTARIHSDTSGYCLAFPGNAQSGDAPLFQDCRFAVQTSELVGLWPDGRITFDPSGNGTGPPLHLAFEAGILRLGAREQVHWFSGSLRINEQVLRAAPGETSGLGAVPLGDGIPELDDIFDFIP